MKLRTKMIGNPAGAVVLAVAAFLEQLGGAFHIAQHYRMS